MRFVRQGQSREDMLIDAIRVALENTQTPVLAAETRLEIVRGVLATAEKKYRVMKGKDPTEAGSSV